MSFDRLPIAGMVVETDGTVVAVNAAAETIVGTELVGRKLWAAMPSLETLWPTVMPAVVLRGEHTCEVAAGPKQIHLMFALRESGGQRAILAFATDLSDRSPGARTSQRLESLGLVAGGIAHEVNNQLVSVIAEAGVAREDDGLSEQTRDALVRIETAAKRMTQLTKQLLAYAGRGRFVTVLIDPDGFLDEKRAALARLVRPSVHFELAPAAGTVAIEADRSLLMQVLRELICNAAEAVRDDGAVRVASRVVTERGSSWWELSVTDDGIGMEPDVVARIYDPFYSTKPERHGLGLSAVLGIVRRLGGMIDVASEPGRGSTFRVRLPVAPGMAPPRRRSTSEQQPIEKLEGMRILIADDEPSVRATIQRLLERRRAIPIIVNDGAEAEARLRHESFDLVLLDVMMPKKTGYQLIPIARLTQPGVPVLLMSGYSEQAKGVEPPDAFLEKPFNGSMLETAIKSALRGENGNGNGRHGSEGT